MPSRAVALTLLMFCSVARADDARAARQHFEAGSSLFDLGRFREAAAEYEEAYRAKNDPALLFNLGQAYRGANDYAKAITAYKAFLRHVPNARNRAEVEDFILRMQQQQQQQQQQQRQQQEQQQQQQIQPQQPPPPSGVIEKKEEPHPAIARADRPFYKRWWLWAAVGGVVVVGVAVGVGVAYGVPKDAPAPPNALTVAF